MEPEEIETVSTPAEAEQAGLDDIISKALDAMEPQKVEESEPEVVAEAETEVEAVVEEKPEAETEEAPPAEETKDEYPAPEDWPEDERAAFATLPEDARKVVLKQYKNFQAGFTRKSQELAGKRKLAEDVETALNTHYGEIMRAKGLAPTAVLQELIAAERAYAQNPVAFVQQLMYKHGIGTTTQQAAAVVDEAKAQGIDPAAITGIVEARLAPMRQAIEQRELQENVKKVTDFKDAKGPDGKLLHPFLADEAKAEPVMARMTSFIHSERMQGRVVNLEDAYKYAVRADDELYKAEVEAARKATLEQEEQKRQAAVAKAKAATGVKRTATPPRVHKKTGNTLDDIISAAFDNISK